MAFFTFQSNDYFYFKLHIVAKSPALHLSSAYHRYSTNFRYNLMQYQDQLFLCMRQMSIRESAPAKIILFGEHAVVYGQPAIAVPISNLRATAQVIALGDDIQIVAYDQENRQIPLPVDNPLRKMVDTITKILDIPDLAGQIELHSAIPIASGLGSGAAIAAAMTRAISKYSGLSLSTEEINEIVYETEKIHHGTPSGIDNTVIVYERPVYFIRGKSIVTIENATPLIILIADTGIPAPTKDSVSDVRKLYDSHPDVVPHVIEKIGQITHQAKQALKSGNSIQLGKLMIENHDHLKALTVSSSELDALVTSSVAAGALGAKLSGGGRGGNMIALVTESTKEIVEKALLEAGAKQVLSTTVEPTI